MSNRIKRLEVFQEYSGVLQRIRGVAGVGLSDQEGCIVVYVEDRSALPDIERAAQEVLRNVALEESDIRFESIGEVVLEVE